VTIEIYIVILSLTIMTLCEFALILIFCEQKHGHAKVLLLEQ